MVLIRALAAMYNQAAGRTATEDYVNGLAQLAGTLAQVARSFRSKIWTRRMVLPRAVEQADGSIARTSSLIQEGLSKSGLDYIALPLGYLNLDRVSGELVDSLRDTSMLFFSLKLSELGGTLTGERARSAAKLLKHMAESAGPLNCARFAFSCGDQPETPYFPDTASSRKGFCLSLRYAREVRGILEAEEERREQRMASLLKDVEEEALTASEGSSLEYLGMDCSLSPWMEESVAGLIERMLGSEFGGLGTHRAVFELNRMISKTSLDLRTLGFNEVMLPVAEDSRLKELALEGRITLSSLISLVSVCVAGLDMVVLPLSTDISELAKALQDVSSIASSKGRAVGIRLVLADGNPGDEVEMGQFGKVPVMDAR
jgi:hypothetical protein